MEQKKILGIVIAVSLFVLIIFGFALVLYSPSRSTGPSLQQAVAVPQDTKSTAAQTDIAQIQAQTTAQNGQLDPDSWARNPATTPGLDQTQEPSKGNINLTIVNGDNATASYSTLDVSGLTKPAAPQQAPAATDGSAAAPANKVSQTTITTPDTRTNADAAPAADKTAAKAKKADVPPAKKTAEPAPAKAEPKKVVTEYWIQAGSFSSKQNAEKTRETLAARYINAEIFSKAASGATSYRVRVGPYQTKTEAEYWLGTIKELPGYNGSYITEVKTKK
jgi:cell division protein FtsN